MMSLEGRRTTLGRVGEIWRYPVKSMLGEKLEAVEISERGLLGDRSFAMVDVETGKVVSAKNPRRWPNLFEFRASYQEAQKPDTSLTAARITFPDGRSCSTAEMEIEPMLSAIVGRSVRLVPVSDISPDAKGEGYWPDHEWLADRDQTFDVDLAPGTFFDGAMLHLVTSATLDHLRSLNLESRFDVRRFRPNLLIQTEDGATGFVESDWIGQTLSIGDVMLRIDRPCPRCVMTTLPQQDLPKDPAVLRTAVRKNDGNVGVYATILQGGFVRLGDELRSS